MLYVLQDRPLQLLTITEPHQASALSGGQKKRIVVLMVNFPLGQRNLMRFFHNDANTALITQIALTKILDFFGQLFVVIQSQFSMSEIIRIFLNFFFIEEYQFRSTFFVIDIFDNINF